MRASTAHALLCYATNTPPRQRDPHEHDPDVPSCFPLAAHRRHRPGHCRQPGAGRGCGKKGPDAPRPRARMAEEPKLRQGRQADPEGRGRAGRSRARVAPRHLRQLLRHRQPGGAGRGPGRRQDLRRDAAAARRGGRPGQGRPGAGAHRSATACGSRRRASWRPCASSRTTTAARRSWPSASWSAPSRPTRSSTTSSPRAPPTISRSSSCRYTNIISPISGVIAQRMVKPGNLIALNAPVFRIVNNSQLEGVLNVPERELATAQGRPAAAHGGRRGAGQGVRGQGRSRVARSMDSASGTFRVVCAFDNAPRAAPGMFGRIEVVYDQRTNALTVPRVALLEDEGEPAVYVDPTARRPSARAGASSATPTARSPRSRSGLKEGDQVVTAGKVAMRDGTEVRGDRHCRRPPRAPLRRRRRGAGAVMNLVEFSTRRRVTVAMVTLTFVLFGLIALSRPQGQPAARPELSDADRAHRVHRRGAGRDREPDHRAGRGSGRRGQEPAQAASSISRTGQSDVVLEFAWGTDMDQASLEVRDKIDVLRLPLEAKEPVLLRFNPVDRADHAPRADGAGRRSAAATGRAEAAAPLSPTRN